MNRTVYTALCMVALLMTGGCASVPKPSLVFQPGVAVNTLSATASLSISKGEQGMGSNGYLLYQSPDRLRMVILSPFGTTVMEAVMSGRQISIIDSSKGVAFSGNLDELPRKGPGDMWRQARWVMELDPPGRFAEDGVQERVNSLGNGERVTFKKGLVVSKVQANGDMVRYGDYELVNGVPLATEIIMDGQDGLRLRIKVTDPEVNAELAADAFIPQLEGLKLYPLGALQEP